MKTIKKMKLSFDKQIITNLNRVYILGGNAALEPEGDKLLTGFDTSCQSSYCD